LAQKCLRRPAVSKTTSRCRTKLRLARELLGNPASHALQKSERHWGHSFLPSALSHSLSLPSSSIPFRLPPFPTPRESPPPLPSHTFLPPILPIFYHELSSLPPSVIPTLLLFSFYLSFLSFSSLPIVLVGHGSRLAHTPCFGRPGWLAGGSTKWGARLHSCGATSSRLGSRTNLYRR